MDTTETYKKMCEEAIEVQNQVIWHSDEKSFYFFTDNGRRRWLPRQDQLQEMVPIPKTASLPTLTQLTLFYQFWQKEDGKHDLPYFAYFTSMEQLWLAFVMKERFSKIWDGTEWVKA